jgi:very-short-patch-repair endonuclease
MRRLELAPSAATDAQRQHGAVQRSSLGWSRHQMRTARRNGWVASPSRRGAVVLAGSASTFQRRCWAELLRCGPEALLSGWTVAHLVGCDGFSEPSSVEIVVPFRKGARSRPGAVVHRSRTLAPLDRTTHAGLRITSGARTIIDLAANPRVSDAMLASAVDCMLRDGYTSSLYLARQLDRLGGSGRRGSARLREVLHGRSGDLHTHLERTYLGRCRDAGLPLPSSQVVIGRRRVDFLYEWLRLVVEVSGHRTHSTRADRRRDAQRQRELVALGYRVIEFTSDEVFDAWHRVHADLLRVLCAEPAR